MTVRATAAPRRRPAVAARTRARTVLLASLALAALPLSASSAQASSATGAAIEGIWSFNGGEVAIQRQPNGVLTGIVVAPTTFVECSHPDGEKMWTNMTLQGDGSYRGLHQWYFQSAACVPNPQLGPTAWRVMQAPGGARYLLVCFSRPGTTQPTIAPSGMAEQATFGCRESARIAPLPLEPPATGPTGAAATSTPAGAGVESFTHSVLLPGNRRCYSRRVFQIHLGDPRHDPLKEVLITLGHRRLRVKRHGNVFVATISLKGLPQGAFTVSIRATTLLGHHLTGSRTYHTCATRASRPRARGFAHL